MNSLLCSLLYALLFWGPLAVQAGLLPRAMEPQLLPSEGWRQVPADGQAAEGVINTTTTSEMGSGKLRSVVYFVNWVRVVVTFLLTKQANTRGSFFSGGAWGFVC